MSLSVGIQSVAFYLLSCGPCLKISHRRNAKKKSARERKEKLAMEEEQPGLYRHPSPFSTNPYWQEEMTMGPHLSKPKQRGGSKNASLRALNTPGSGCASGGHMDGAAESPTTATEGSRISGEGWNTKRYQREDEDLWGREIGPGQRIMDAIAKAGSSAGRLLEGISKPYAKEEQPSPYFTARNPPINELHPPIVSTQTTKTETRWMLQPPPPAKIMEGKERVVRSRAGSSGSSRRSEAQPLSRLVTEKLVDQKLQRGETPTLLETTSTPSTSSGMFLHDRSGSASSQSSGSTNRRSMNRPRRPPPIKTTIMRKSRDKAEHIPQASNGTEMQERAARPALPTVPSSSTTIPLITEPSSALKERSSSSSATNIQKRANTAGRSTDIAASTKQAQENAGQIS